MAARTKGEFHHSVTTSTASAMISQFWSLCRACPSMDIDKVSMKKGIIGVEVRWKLVGKLLSVVEMQTVRCVGAAAAVGSLTFCFV